MEECIWRITTEEAQIMAERLLGRRLSPEEIEIVKRGVEFRMEDWDEILRYAILDAVEGNTTENS